MVTKGWGRHRAPLRQGTPCRRKKRPSGTCDMEGPGCRKTSTARPQLRTTIRLPPVCSGVCGRTCPEKDLEGSLPPSQDRPRGGGEVWHGGCEGDSALFLPELSARPACCRSFYTNLPTNNSVKMLLSTWTPSATKAENSLTTPTGVSHPSVDPKPGPDRGQKRSSLNGVTRVKHRRTNAAPCRRTGRHPARSRLQTVC